MNEAFVHKIYGTAVAPVGNGTFNPVSLRSQHKWPPSWLSEQRLTSVIGVTLKVTQQWKTLCICSNRLWWGILLNQKSTCSRILVSTVVSQMPASISFLDLLLSNNGQFGHRPTLRHIMVYYMEVSLSNNGKLLLIELFSFMNLSNLLNTSKPVNIITFLNTHEKCFPIFLWFEPMM